MSQVVQQEALTRLLVEKGIFREQEFWEKGVTIVKYEPRCESILRREVKCFLSNVI